MTPLGMTVKFDWHGPTVKAKEHDGAVVGLRKAAEHVLGESIKVVPYEDGDLQDSARASVDASSLEAAVSYDTPYAVYQHEELDLRHDDGRTAKYLERPLDENRDYVAQLVAANIRRAMGG